MARLANAGGGAQNQGKLSAAAKGASLLNAARAGKLSRPRKAETPSSPRSTARRDEVYEIEVSPEKPKSTRQIPHSSDRPGATQAKSRCTAVLYKFSKQLGPHNQQCQNQGSHDTAKGARCTFHLRNDGAKRCSEIITHGTMTVQCDKVATNHDAENPLCKVHAPKAHKKKTGPARRIVEDDQLQESSRDPQSNGDTIIVPNQLNKDPSSQDDESEKQVPARSLKRRVIPRQQSQASKRRKPSPALNSIYDLPEDSDHEMEDEDFQDALEDIVPSDVVEDISEDEDLAKPPNGTTRHESSTEDDMTSGMFAILDQEERGGQCRTKMARKIVRACKEMARKDDSSPSVIREGLATIQGLLDGIRSKSLDAETQQDLKGDAFAYVFRALAQNVKQACDSCREVGPNTTEILDQLHALASFVDGIVSFRDRITSWNVPLPVQYKDKGISKAVDSIFLARLRKFRINIQTQIRDLTLKSHKDKELQEQKRKREEDVMRQVRAQAEQGRKAAWQLIVVERMTAESDPFMRMKLIPNNYRDSEENMRLERDANGEEYERLAVFKQRSIPPSYPSSSRTWTERQETALLKTLQTLLSYDPETTPLELFKHVFAQHCNFGGDLRPFGALEIADKMAYLRQHLTTQYTENGWEVPNWVQSIPVLP